jgi:hypothetical protein
MSYNDFLATLDRTYGAPPTQEAPSGGFGSDIARGFGGLVQGTGTALRDAGAERYGLALERYGQGVQERNPSRINSLDDVLNNPFTTVREAVGENIPTIGAILGGARLGAMAGGAVGGLPGAAAGGFIGGLAAPFVQSYGGIRERQRQTGEESIPTALAGASASSVVERFVGPERFIGRAAGGLVRPGENYFARVGRNTALGAAGEGAVEPVQTAIERAAGGQALTGDEALDEYAVSAAKGAAGGGAIRGGISTLPQNLLQRFEPERSGSADTEAGAAEKSNQQQTTANQPSSTEQTFADISGPSLSRGVIVAAETPPPRRAGTMVDIAGKVPLNQGNAPANMADFYTGIVPGVDDPYVGMRGDTPPRRNLGLPVIDPMAGYRGESGEVGLGAQLDLFSPNNISPANTATQDGFVSPSNQREPLDLRGFEAGTEADPRQGDLLDRVPSSTANAGLRSTEVEFQARPGAPTQTGVILDDVRQRIMAAGERSPYALQVGVRVSQLLRAGKPAEAATFLAREDDRLRTSNTTNIDNKIRSLSAAQAAVEDYVQRDQVQRRGDLREMAQEGQRRARPGATTNTSPDLSQSDTEQEMRRANTRRPGAVVDSGPTLSESVTEQEMRERNLAQPVPQGGNTRAATESGVDVQTVVENERRERSARERMGLLQAVLDDPTTANPVGRFTASLRRAGFRDTGITADEAQTIERFESFRAAAPAPQDRSGVEPLEALIPERRSAAPTPSPQRRTQPEAVQPRRLFLNTEKREELNVPPEARPEAAPAPDEGVISDPSQISMFSGATPNFTKNATGQTLRQQEVEADRILAEMSGSRSKDIFSVIVNAFRSREVDMAFVRDVAGALKAKQFRRAETLVSPFRDTPPAPGESVRANDVAGNPVGPMPRPTGDPDFDAAAMNRWRAENARSAEMGITWQAPQPDATPQDVGASGQNQPGSPPRQTAAPASTPPRQGTLRLNPRPTATAAPAPTPAPTPAAEPVSEAPPNSMRAAMEKAQLEKAQAEAELVRLQVEKARAEAAAAAPTPAPEPATEAAPTPAPEAPRRAPTKEQIATARKAVRDRVEVAQSRGLVTPAEAQQMYRAVTSDNPDAIQGVQDELNRRARRQPESTARPAAQTAEAPPPPANIGTEIGEALRSEQITASQARYLRTLMAEDGEDTARTQLEEYRRTASGRRPQVSTPSPEQDRTVDTRQVLDPEEVRRRLLSRGRASARSEGTMDAETGATLSVNQVQQVVADRTRGWGRAPRIEVVESFDALPAEISEDLQGRGYQNVYGAYDRETGTVYLVANRFSSPAQVQATLYHESLGHFGLKQALGERLTSVLGAIYRTNPAMRQQADAYMARNPDAFADTETRGAFAVEEVLASAAEQGGRIPQGVFDRIKTTITQFARRMGLYSGDYSNAEVAAILNQAMSQVERPGSDPGPGRGRRDDARQRLEPTMARGEEPNLATTQGLRSMLAGRQGIVADVAEKGRIARLATLFGNQLEDLYGKMLPQLKTYNAFQGKAAARVSTIADKARDYLDQWDRLGAHNSMTAAQVQKATGDLLLDSTFNQMRPDLPLTDDVNSEVTSDEARAKYKALQERFTQLPPSAQKVYKDVLGQFKENLDEKRRLFLAQSDKLGQDGLNDNAVQELKRDIERFFKQIKVYFPLSRFGDYVVVASKPEYEALNEQTKAAYQRVEDLQNASASKEDVEAARKEASDLAARRRKVAETGYIVQAFDKPSEQQAAVKRYQGAGYSVQPLRAHDYQPEIDGVSSRFLDKMKESLAVEAQRGGAGSPRAIMAEQFSNLLQQTYFQSLPEHHALKSSMRRNYVEGFSRDARRAFASSMLRDGHYLARLEFAQQTQDTLEEMRLEARKADKAVIDKNPNAPMMAQAVYEEVAKRHASSLRYVETPVSDALANMGYVWFLGFTPSFMLMNMMQTPMVTMPMVAARFGLGRTGGALTKAMQEAGSAQAKAWERDGRFGEVKPEDLTTDPAERSAIQELMNRGTIDLTQEHDLGAVATGRSTGWQKMMRYASYLPHYTEKFNRLATALASYRLAMDGFERAAGNPQARPPVPVASDSEYGSYAKSHIEEQQRLLEAGRIQAATPPLTVQQFSAMRFAQKMVNDSHFDYSAENAPRWMRPSVFPLSKVMFQFKKYQVAMGYAVINNAYQMLKNTDPQERRIARRTFFGLLATHGLMAGSLGLPGAGAAIFAANMVANLFGDEDEPWDAEAAYRTFLVDAMSGFTDDPQLRRQLGEMVSRGVLRAPVVRDTLAGDVSQRVGLGDLFSPVRLRQGDNTGRDKWNEIMASLFGPASSIGGDYFEAVRYFQANQPAKGVEMMMPKVVRDILRANRFATEGVTTTRDNVVMSPDKISQNEIAAQLFGFTPSRIMESYEARGAVEGARRQVSARRQSLLKSYSEAIIAGDQEELAEARAQIERFNRIRRENREPIIKGQDLLRSVQERRRFEQELTNGVRLRRNEQSFARYGAFANTD